MQPATATRDDLKTPVGNDELAEGLLLVRASTLKIIRLQLAMERRDRRVALEAVDDLVALDRSLENFLAQIPSVHDDGLFGNVLELERSALNVEKHTLAGGISNREWQLQEPEIGASEPACETSDDGTAYEELGQPLRSFRRAAIALGFLAIAAVAYLLGASGQVPEFLREIL